MAADWAFPRRPDAGGDGSAREAGGFLFRECGRGRLENERRGENVETDFRLAADRFDRMLLHVAGVIQQRNVRREIRVRPMPQALSRHGGGKHSPKRG